MFVQVIPFDRSFDDLGFTYLVPDFLKESVFLGALLEIPFGNKIIKAIIVDLFDSFDDSNISLKPIISISYDFPLMQSWQIELVKWMPKYYFSLAHQVLSLFFPRNLLDKIQKGKFLLKDNKQDYFYNNTKKLTINQQEVYEEILNTNSKNILLFGVTGSGKTEIYINLINDLLKKDKQVLLLVPEIILSSQVANYVKNVFGENVAIINSSVSDAKKTDVWQNIYSGNTKIVVGTRSALFYPYKNLGMIIVDEEHDNSYISDSAPRYDSIEVVKKISEILGIKILLASGTPSISHMYKSLKEKSLILNLFEEIK